MRKRKAKGRERERTGDGQEAGGKKHTSPSSTLGDDGDASAAPPAAPHRQSMSGSCPAGGAGAPGEVMTKQVRGTGGCSLEAISRAGVVAELTPVKAVPA